MRTGLATRPVVVLAALAIPNEARAQGLYFPGGGAAHLSMGGASTATQVDAIGSIYWNPAAIGRLGRSPTAGSACGAYSRRPWGRATRPPTVNR
jgi:hypothetical protein